MKHARALMVTIALLGPGVLAGCGSVATASGEPGPIAFKADDAPAEGATIALQSTRSLGDVMVVDVVARGAKELHGAAFRLSYDPEVLTFASSEAGGSWSKSSFALTREATPGLLLVTWSEKGEVGIDASKDTVLGSLTFQVKGRKATPLSFKVERSQIVDKRGGKLAASWRGGTLAAR